MSIMVEVKTAELVGPALDWAVASIEGLNIHGLCAGGFVVDCEDYSPSTNWSQGGPLIEKYMVRTQYAADTEKRSDAGCLAQTWRPYALAHGETLLIATRRAIVRAAAEIGANMPHA